jgi:hypothetical protein
MWELPSAVMVSNRCWSVMINSISGRVRDIFVMVSREHLNSTGKSACKLSHKCHSERSEESLIISGAIFRGTVERCFAKPVLSEAEGLNMTASLTK